MKELNEYTAEVFRRMEKGIEERRKRRKTVLMCAVPMCLCIVITLALTLPSVRPDANIATGDGNETTAEEQTTLSDIEEDRGGARYDVGPMEPGLWESACTLPYGIVQINEITNETIRLYQGHSGANYVKVKCKIIWSCNTEHFTSEVPFYAGDNKYIDFNAVEEIYITEKSSTELKASDVIFICVEQMNLGGVYYNGPVTADDTGESEYIPIVDGKLQMSEGNYDTASFYSLRELNNTVDNVAKALNSGKEGTAFDKAVPKKKIGNGMTVEEIEEFFAAWDEARDVVRLERQNQTNAAY